MLEKSLCEKSSRAAGQIKVDLGVTTKLAWISWCKEQQLVPGAEVRRLVEVTMANGSDAQLSAPPAMVKVKVQCSADSRPKVGREIYFSPSEDEAIQVVAKAQGFGFHEWVVAAVRGALVNAPSYGQIELEALTRSNTMLAQVAADLAALRRGSANLELAQQLQALEGHVKAHVEQASTSMAQGARRWSLKV